jgi:predicted small integral membrane protein
MIDHTKAVSAPVEHKGRKGFLPMETNLFDRISISVYIFVAICLLWLRFIEPLGPNVIYGALLCVLLGIFIVRKG